MSFSKNLILDLDGTLIDAQTPAGASSALILGRSAPAHVCGANLGHLRIYKRPGLDAFLEWCFHNFDNVGIWTLSASEWLDEVLDNVLSHFPRHKWTLLWTAERATKLRHTSESHSMSDVKFVKDLKKVFRNKELRRRGFTRWNTLIVEDTPGNCVRNYGNAVYVSAFDVVSSQRDEELAHLTTYFQKTLLPSVNVRHIEKRRWLTEILNEKARQTPEKNSESVAFWMTDSWKTNLVDMAARSLKL